MTRRRAAAFLTLLGLALCGAAQAATPLLELSASAAWKGWSRPGRATEVDIRIGADAAGQATLDLTASRLSARAELDLQPGRGQRLQMLVGAAEQVAVVATPAGGAAQRFQVDIARSESPILGVALAAGGAARLDGFHSIELAADDLPRNAAAYASIDALIVDAPTLDALDARQRDALLARAAACDRIVVLNLERARRPPDAATGCAGGALASAASLPEALERLQASLATGLPRPMAFAGIGELAPPDAGVWQTVAVALGLYFALTASMLIFGARLPLLLALPALCAAAVLPLLHALTPPSQLVVWSEGASGAPLARYQAWQRFAGVRRERLRAPLPPQLAAGAQPCDARQALHFDIDARGGRPAAVAFDTRLFGRTPLCYAGTFPMARALAVDDGGADSRQLRNTGAAAWPGGTLLAGGQAYALPPLEPGARIAVATGTGRAPDGAVQRIASIRTQAQGAPAGALWPLDLGGVAGLPRDARGWLLVTVARR